MPARSAPSRPRTRRPCWPRRLAVATALWAMVVSAAGCVGQASRNDDHVGPHSPRPDARERS